MMLEGFYAQPFDDYVGRYTDGAVTFGARQSTGSISGYIYDEGANPISGANFSAYNWSVGRFSTNADGSGHYTLSGIPSGEYSIVAWAAGREYRVNYSTVVPPSGTVVSDFHLGPSGVISGTVVTRTLAPVPNAQLRLSIIAINTTMVATSNAAGQFTFDDYLRTGNYTIFTSAEGFITLASRIFVEGGATSAPQIVINRSAVITGTIKDDLGANINGARVVAYNNTYMGLNDSIAGSYTIDHDLGPGIYFLEAFGTGYVRRNFIGPVNLAIEGNAACNIVLNRSAKLHGTVRNTQGYGIQGVRLDLNGIDSGEMQTGYSDIAGNYMFDTNLAPGRYVMKVSAPGYVDKDIPQFSIGFADNKTMQITLNRTGRLYGTVHDQYHDAVVGAQVTAYLQSMFGTGTNETDGTGAWTISGLDAGTYIVYATADGYLSGGHVTVNLIEGQNISISLQLNATGCVNGTVVNAAGRPVEGAKITATDGLGNEYFAYTNETGAYTLKGTIPAGTYNLTATADGYNDGTRANVAVSKVGITYANFTLLYMGGVSGIVCNPEGAPIAGAKVALFGLGQYNNMSTLDNGTFSFEYPMNIQEGEYTLAVSAPGYTNYLSAPFMVVPGEIFRTNVTLSRILSISSPAEGQNFTSPLVTISGNAAAGAAVTIEVRSVASGDSRNYAPSVGADGRFSVQTDLFWSRNVITVVASIGNNSIAIVRTVFYTVPTLTITSPTNGSTIALKSLVVTGTALNYLGGLDVSISARMDNEEYSPAVGNGSWIWYKTISSSYNGPHVIFVRAVDTLGEVVKSVAITVNIPERVAGVKVEAYIDNVTSEAGVVSCKFRVINTGNELDDFKVSAQVNKQWTYKFVGNGTLTNVRDGSSEFVTIKVTFPNNDANAILTLTATSVYDPSVTGMANIQLKSTKRPEVGEINMVPIVLMFAIIGIIIAFGLYTWKKTLEPSKDETYDVSASQYYSSYDLAVERSRSHGDKYAGSGFEKSYNGEVIRSQHFARYGEERISYSAGERMTGQGHEKENER